MSVDTLDTIQQKLIRFLEEEILLDKEQSKIAPGESLFSGVLDSLGTLRLVVFIEETYSIQVADGELIPENFDTVERLAKYIQTKTTGSQNVKRNGARQGRRVESSTVPRRAPLRFTFCVLRAGSAS